MESAITNEATPAVTPMTEMIVITPITACRRFARRYRAATKSSNLTRTPQKADGLSCGCPLERKWEKRDARLVVAIALAKSFFQFIFLDPRHKRKREEHADREQNKADRQAAANSPSGKIQQVGHVNGMAHAGVQSRSDQFLRMLFRSKLGFTAQFVRTKTDPGIHSDAHENQHPGGGPHPG